MRLRFCRDRPGRRDLRCRGHLDSLLWCSARAQPFQRNSRNVPAVSFIMATAFAAVVSAFVTIILDIIGKAGGSPNFSSYLPSGIHVGLLLTALIAFLIIAAVLDFAVVVPYTHARRYLPTDEAAAPEDVALLTEIRDLLAQRNNPASSDPWSLEHLLIPGPELNRDAVVRRAVAPRRGMSAGSRAHARRWLAPAARHRRRRRAAGVAPQPDRPPVEPELSDRPDRAAVSASRPMAPPARVVAAVSAAPARGPTTTTWWSERDRLG